MASLDFPGRAGKVRLARPDVGVEEAAAVAEVLESGQLTMGPKVAEFESELAGACEVEYAVAVSSGTAALHLALLALGVGPGDEVVVPAYTFPATANVVALCGARPVLCDVDPMTMNLDLAHVPRAISRKTRAVLGVHLFGRPLAWEELRDAVPEGVTLVEDAAGALGARRQGKACGSLGAAGCLSFHPRKVVTTGEGGAVTTNDAELADLVRSLRHHGWVGEDLPHPGFNYRLPDVLCAVGIPQVRRLRELLGFREELATAYEERLAELELVLPSTDPGDQHGWQAYVVQTANRDEALAALREAGIEAQIGTYGVHRLSAYLEQGDFPGADAAYERALALPFHSQLTESDLDRVAAVLIRL